MSSSLSVATRDPKTHQLREAPWQAGDGLEAACPAKETTTHDWALGRPSTG